MIRRQGRAQTGAAAALAALAAFASIWPARAAHAQTSLSITGTISNGTPGSPPPAGLEVTAVQIGGDGGEIVRKESKASGSSFRVEGFQPRHGQNFVVGTDYLGVTYSSVVSPPESASGAKVDLTVFEVTRDEGAISVSSDSMTVATGKNGRLEILELLRVHNSSARTYVGSSESGSRQVLGLPMAAGGTDLVALEGLTPKGLTPSSGGFWSADPVLPGDTSISYLYRVQSPRSGLQLRRSSFYPTGHLDLLVAKDLAVKAPGMAFQEKVTLSGQPYRRYRGGPFAAGAVFEAEIGGASSPTSSLWWGLAAGLVTLALAVSIPVAARRRRAGSPPAEDREALLNRIAALDEAFEKGSIPEDEYRGTRRKLKGRLEVAGRDSSPAS